MKTNSSLAVSEELNLNLPLLEPAGVRVPNQFPTATEAYRIAIIGEAPGEDEVERGKPFVGMSGRLLDVVLTNAGINRAACLMGNVCQFRPPNNNIEKFKRDGPEFTEGLQALTADLAAFKPHLCVLLGNTPLRVALGPDHSISNWRGSLFRSNINGSPFFGYKCIAAYHPAAVLREYSHMPLLRNDLGRARHQGRSSELELPNRVFELSLTASELVTRIRAIPKGTKVSVDIEGFAHGLGVRCISISTDPRTGFIIAFESADGGSNFTLDEEIEVWRAFSELMWSMDHPKVLQNSMYDRFVLAWLCKVLIRNISDDTMVKHWELYCELEKDLGLLTSIYTYQPYYKGDWKTKGPTLWNYCCLDSAVTLECDGVIDKQLSYSDRKHYQFNMEFLEALFYLELRGMGYDKENAEALKSQYTTKSFILQDQLNRVAGRQLRFPTSELAFEHVVGRICYKRASPNTWDDIANSSIVLKPYKESAPRIAALCRRINTSPEERLSDGEWGELSFLLGEHLNTASTAEGADMQWFLYEHQKFPPQYKKEHGRKTDKVSTDVKALLTLYAKFPGNPVLLDILRMRSMLGKIVTLSALVDHDGRMRGSYNGVGSETGRVQVRKSPSGSGFNLQTVTSELRVNFIADPDYDMFQVDLAGADGVTVAAWAKYFGDPTMWDDYKFGIKPANFLALTYEFGTDVLRMSREQLKWASKFVDKDGWIYFASKRVHHGSSYKMGTSTMSEQVLMDSFKKGGDPIFVAPKVCGVLQGYFFQRYWGVEKWQNYVADTVLKTSKLTSASGHTRKFFGRKRENGVLNHETWKQALADEPQNNTTYATNLAMLRLYNDPDNRQRPYQYRGPNTARNHYPGALIIEPLHQIHDALLGQWPKSERDWARPKVKEYFNNELDIAHGKVVIPFEGNWGPNWANLKEKL